jgi:hypothetical protein
LIKRVRKENLKRKLKNTDLKMLIKRSEDACLLKDIRRSEAILFAHVDEYGVHHFKRKTSRERKHHIREKIIISLFELFDYSQARTMESISSYDAEQSSMICNNHDEELCSPSSPFSPYHQHP